MLDDTSKQASDERPRINVHKESDLKYWAERFGISHEKLRQTVATVGSTIEAVKKHLGKYPRRDMRWALRGAAALLLTAAWLGCDRVRCEDRGEAAIQAVLPHLGQDVVSNLVGEASLCIADALAEPVVPQFYTPTVEKAPVAHGLTVVPASDFSIGMGATIVVRTRGTSAPYMAVRVPVQFGSGLCLWGVYVCVKPGGGFAKDNPGWVVAEGGTNAAPVVKLTDEVLLYAQQRSLQ